MYLRKMSPRTLCLYSAISIWPRSLSAAISRRFYPFPPYAYLAESVNISKKNYLTGAQLNGAKARGGGLQQELTLIVHPGPSQELPERLWGTGLHLVRVTSSEHTHGLQQDKRIKECGADAGRLQKAGITA